jgi:hypothetical protein
MSGPFSRYIKHRYVKTKKGISTYLYFQTIINLAVLLTIAFFVFSIFALTTNIISSGKVTDANTLQKAKVSSNSDIILLSLGIDQLI